MSILCWVHTIRLARSARTCAPYSTIQAPKPGVRFHRAPALTADCKCVAAHACSGIVNLETKEMSSLSVEPADEESEIVVSLFDVKMTPKAVTAWLEREHEYRFVAVETHTLDGTVEPNFAVRYTCFFSCNVSRLLWCTCMLLNTSCSKLRGT
jgi:hypothetical protein